MKHQFYLVLNPKAPEDPQYIFHSKYPRFFAEIVNDSLELCEMIDIDPEKLEGKFKRMKDWYRDYLINKKQSV